MNKFCFIILVCCMGASMQHVYGQTSVRQADTLMRYYGRLANSANESERAQLETTLYRLLKSDQENDWLTARRFFYQMKKNKTADSITSQAKIRFPSGAVVRDEKVKNIYDEKDPAKKEKIYWDWVKQFPPAKFDADQRIIYDYARNSVGTAWAEAGNIKKAVQFANMVETPAWKGEGWAGVAQVLVKKGYLKEATELYTKAREHAHQFMTTKRNEPGAGFAAIGYKGYTNALGRIYLEQKDYAAALQYVKEAYDSSKTISGAISEDYARVLLALGKDQEAYKVIDAAVKEGQATVSMKRDMKDLYAKVNGSNAGYDEYMASVNKALVEKIKKDLTKQMVDMPAADFSLKDVDGNTVSLSDFKGKIVVLDFWATWCGPCKRSFPSMKLAMERFRDNPDVKFLFIHTMERDANAGAEAKNYVTDNNLPFHVLMDMKDADGVNKVATSYKVDGIPVKFVIDRNGRVRFRFLGFSGGDDAAVEEVTAMVQLAGAQTTTAQLNIGDRAPAVKVMKWFKGVPLNHFEKGKVYVVEFWATWCLPCIAGMPHLSELSNKYKHQVSVAGISVLERKTTTIARVGAFVDSMGKKMDYSVAIDDSSFMAQHWLKASGEGGIPFAWVIDQEGRIAWMGHPKKLDQVLPSIINKTWNIAEATEKRNKLNRIKELDRNEVWERLNKFMGKADKQDSALLEISRLISEEPGLKYAPRVGHYTFWTLIKTDPAKAVAYGRALMQAESYDDPPYKSITDAVTYMVESAKKELPATVYELGAEAYRTQIEKYPWSMNIPVTYDKMAYWYFLAKNKPKAIEAENKAITVLHEKGNADQKQIEAYREKLSQYRNM